MTRRVVLHDTELYPQPDEVNPERYLNRTDECLNPDPREFAFGYGRRCVSRTNALLSETDTHHPRVCPGRIFAEDTLFITAAFVLASFNVSDAVSLKGGRITYTDGLIRLINHWSSRLATYSPHVSVTPISLAPSLRGRVCLHERASSLAWSNMHAHVTLQGWRPLEMCYTGTHMRSRL